MKTHTKTLLASLTASAMIAGSASAETVAFDFGDMDLSGDSGTGWIITQGGHATSAGFAGVLTAELGGGAVPSDNSALWFQANATSTGGGVGTSNGDKLAAGDYTVSFIYADYINGIAQITAGLSAWNGSTSTQILAPVNLDMSAGLDVWNRAELSFSIAEGSALIGQDLQLVMDASAPSTSYIAFEGIAGTFTAISESTPLTTLSDFTYDSSTNTFGVSLEGAPNTAYFLEEAADLDFSTPDQSPIPLDGAAVTVGVLDTVADTITTDGSGNATLEDVSLGAPAKDATFIRAKTAPSS